MKVYQKPDVTLILLDNTDIVTASAYTNDVFKNDGWTPTTFEEGN